MVVKYALDVKFRLIFVKVVKNVMTAKNIMKCSKDSAFPMRSPEGGRRNPSPFIYIMCNIFTFFLHIRTYREIEVYEYRGLCEPYNTC